MESLLTWQLPTLMQILPSMLVTGSKVKLTSKNTLKAIHLTVLMFLIWTLSTKLMVCNRYSIKCIQALTGIKNTITCILGNGAKHYDPHGLDLEGQLDVQMLDGMAPGNNLGKNFADFSQVQIFATMWWTLHLAGCMNLHRMYFTRIMFQRFYLCLMLGMKTLNAKMKLLSMFLDLEIAALCKFQTALSMSQGKMRLPIKLRL